MSMKLKKEQLKKKTLEKRKKSKPSIYKIYPCCGIEENVLSTWTLAELRDKEEIIFMMKEMLFKRLMWRICIFYCTKPMKRRNIEMAWV